MSLYGEYLDAKSELLSKELDFERAVDIWFDERDLPCLLDMTNILVVDNFTIKSNQKFGSYLDDFRKAFGARCVRIYHQEIKIPGERVEHVWKYHFKEDN